MAGNETTTQMLRTHLIIDLLLIAAISFVAEATHFSYKQGRALPCGDSAQYVASAEALLVSNETPHFEMRKPGYAFYLAGAALLSGNMGWAAVLGHHVCMGLLPLLAYGFGVHLRSRWVGWLAAGLTVARLQTVVWGERVMSETLYACIFTFGMLLFLTALARPKSRWRMIGAGTVLGLAWLTRGTATPVIAVAAAAILVTQWREHRQALISCLRFSAPIACCVIAECSINLTHAGGFRTANGTVGATLLLRARHFEGFDLPDTPEADRVFALLPERNRDEAYLASHLDVWVARHRAIHDQGMSEWEYDDLMRSVGLDALTNHFGAYARSSLRLTLCHLLRRPDGQALSPVPEDRRTGPLIHPMAPIADRDNWDMRWFAYYGLPHLTPAESMAVVDRMEAAASTRARLGTSPVWKTLRYWKTKPVADRTLAGLVWLGSLWPGWALIGCFFLGLNRKSCAVLAVAYLVDALFLGFLTPTNIRLQFAWIVTDTALAAGLVVGLTGLAAHASARVRALLEGPDSTHRMPDPGSL